MVRYHSPIRSAYVSQCSVQSRKQQFRPAHDSTIARSNIDIRGRTMIRRRPAIATRFKYRWHAMTSPAKSRTLAASSTATSSHQPFDTHGTLQPHHFANSCNADDFQCHQLVCSSDCSNYRNTSPSPAFAHNLSGRPVHRHVTLCHHRFYGLFRTQHVAPTSRADHPL